jgi:hypothetical protein
MPQELQLRLHEVRAKPAPMFVSETWIAKCEGQETGDSGPGSSAQLLNTY